MGNNTDLVDAIDEAIECIEDNTYHNGAEFRTYEMDEQQRELVRVSLIRARDALRWIPCEERLPEEGDRVLVQGKHMFTSGHYWKNDFCVLTSDGVRRGKDLPFPIEEWMPAPYTPEEK